ncbi:MAG: hypothetical protein ISR69_06090 [Gammaproteobacteria bacterium]|nr:hypothetical protein [Gammaproteobacteria bacterium]
MSAIYEKKFGAFVDEYKKSWWLLIGWFLLFILPSFFILNSTAVNEHEPIAIVSGLLLLPIPMLIIFLDRLRSRVSLYENGIIQNTLFGRSEVKFDANAKFRYKVFSESISGIPTGTKTKLQVVNGKQKVLINSSYVGVDVLHADFREKELGLVYPAMKKAYLEGKTIDFNALKLKTNQFVFNKKTIAFNEINDISLQSGHLQINKKGKRLPFVVIAVSEISNLYTLLQLFHDLRA